MSVYSTMLDCFSIVAHLESGLASGSHIVKFFPRLRHLFLTINGWCDTANTVFGITKTGLHSFGTVGGALRRRSDHLGLELSLVDSRKPHNNLNSRW